MPHSDTVAVHAGEPTLDRKDAPVTPDISVGSASGYPDLKTLDAAMAEHRGYGRWGTDNHRQLEAAVAGLESNGLATRLEAVSVGSGMAAIAVALMSEMNAGDHDEMDEGLDVLERLGDTQQVGRFERLQVG